MNLDGALLILLMEFASSFISFIVGYYALKGYRASGSRGLLLLYLGFLILGIGIFLRVLAATYFAVILRVLERPNLLGLLNLTVLLYTLTQLTAYGLFTATYILQAQNAGKRGAEMATVTAAAVPVGFRLFYIPQLELMAITLLGFITAYLFTNWLLKRGSDAALVFLGFGFMLTSHVFFLSVVFGEIFLFFGQATQLAGFICLLAMLAKVSKTNA
jgi:hypothetical protein